MREITPTRLSATAVRHLGVCVGLEAIITHEQFAVDIAQLLLPKFLIYSRHWLFPDTKSDDALMQLRLGLHVSDRVRCEATDTISNSHGALERARHIQACLFLGCG